MFTVLVEGPQKSINMCIFNIIELLVNIVSLKCNHALVCSRASSTYFTNDIRLIGRVVSMITITSH